MTSADTPHFLPALQSYASAVKRLSFSSVSRSEKISICRHLLSSQYHPDPSAVVLKFSCSLIAKDAPAVEDCYVVNNSNSIPELAQQDWKLLKDALLKYKQSCSENSDYRDVPVIPNAVLVQGGLHLLRGCRALQTAVAETLCLILKQSQVSQDLETHTWLSCAIARVEGLDSVTAPLRAVILPRYSLILSREHDKDRLAAAAASIVSQAVPSWLASELESVVIHSICGSPRTFHERVSAWISRSEATLPQAVHFLLRAYAKHSPEKREEQPSAKKRPWEPARRDAIEFFETVTDHMLLAIRVDGDQRLWDEQKFYCRMKAIQSLYLIGSENAAYLPIQDQPQREGNKRKKTPSGRNQSSPATGLRGLLLELIGIACALQAEAEVNNKKVKFTFQAICAVAKFSVSVIDEVLPKILALCLTSNKHQCEAREGIANKCELFCTLVFQYEQSRALNKFMNQLSKTSSVRLMTAVMRQKHVQEVLGATFSRLREAEAQTCIRSLVPTSPEAARDISSLTLILSLLLETVASSFVPLTAITIANRIVFWFLQLPVNSEIRQCRMHLLSSFLIAIASNSRLSAEGDIRIAMLKLANLNDAENAVQVSGAPLESMLVDTLDSGVKSMSAPELCSNLRCLTALAHYSFQQHENRVDREFITRVLNITFARFSILKELMKNSNVSKKDGSFSNLLYGSVNCSLVLPWLGSLGTLIRRVSFLQKGKSEILPFLSQALTFFPVTHPFWNELREDQSLGAAFVKASCTVLERPSQSLNCPKCIRSCLRSRVLANISVTLPYLFVERDHDRLLRIFFHCIAFPCCTDSSQEALNVLKDFRNTPGLRNVLLTFFQHGEDVSILKAELRMCSSSCKRKSISTYKRMTVTMRVVASQRPEKLLSLLSQTLGAELRKEILRLTTTFRAESQSLTPVQETSYETVGALLDLRAGLESAKSIGVKLDEISAVEDAATECIKVALPVCVKSLTTSSSKEMPHSEAADYMLSAMVRGSSPIHRLLFWDEEGGSLQDVLTQTYVRKLLLSPCEKEDLVNLPFEKLLVFEGSSRRRLCHVLLSLRDRVLRSVLSPLHFILRDDNKLATEAASKLLLMATRLTTLCARMCNTSRFPLIEKCETDAGAPVHPDLQSDAILGYNTSTRILSGLEAFLRMLSRTIRELSRTRVQKLQSSALIGSSDSLVFSSLKACLEVVVCNRSWLRGDMENVVLLTRQVVERVCSFNIFLRNEGGSLLNAMRICKVAVKRHSGLVPSASQVISVLLRRGINTENMVIIAAVREAVEEVSNVSKRLEILSALLADCSIALDETVGSDSRREAEKSTAFLFKSIGERRAQQVLSCLRDSARESLRQVWEMFSDNMHYRGK